MKYRESIIKKGIKLHIINTEKFKTNLISIMITTKLQREDVTKNALIPAVLKRGTANMTTQEEINKKLEEMYGASFDCGIDKTGDNQVLKFYLETINDEFAFNKNEKLLQQAIEKLFEIIFNPYLENGYFKEEYVKQEKENLKQIIQSKIDSKARYALDRCIEEMYKDAPFGIYKYGYTEDLEKIDAKNLFEQYQKLINESKIDIFVSGILYENIEEIVKENENIKKLVEREANYVVPEIKEKESVQEKEIIESMDVTQGKVIIGLDVNINDDSKRYATMLYNSLLGGSANSKLFQNVREKASLAYTASSSYMRFKNNIFINCGIEINNYDKALKIIREQIDSMKNGDFTEDEIQNAKKGIIASIKAIDDEQDTEITYYFGQEMSKNEVDLDTYMKNIEQIKKSDIQEIANKVTVNTIYFLKN